MSYYVFPWGRPASAAVKIRIRWRHGKWVVYCPACGHDRFVSLDLPFAYTLAVMMFDHHLYVSPGGRRCPVAELGMTE